MQNAVNKPALNEPQNSVRHHLVREKQRAVLRHTPAVPRCLVPSGCAGCTAPVSQVSPVSPVRGGSCRRPCGSLWGESAGRKPWMSCLILSSCPEFHTVFAIGLFVLPEWKGRVLSAKPCPEFGDTLLAPKVGSWGLGSLRNSTSPCCCGVLPTMRIRVRNSSRPELCAGFQSGVPGAVGLGLRPLLPHRGEADPGRGGEGAVPCPPRGCPHRFCGPSLLSVSPGGCECPLPARFRGGVAPTVRPLSSSAAARPNRPWGDFGDRDAAPRGPPWLCHARGCEMGSAASAPSCAGLRGALLPPRGRCAGSGSRGQHGPRQIN